MSGSDTGKWTRFRILGLIPVARMGGESDHARAAFGRYVAEVVFWSPAALLPGPGIAWKALDQDTVRVTVTRNEFSQAVDIKVDAEGWPVMVHFMRWSDADPEKRYRLQPVVKLVGQRRDGRTDMAKIKKKLTPAQKRARAERKKLYQTEFINGKQVSIKRPPMVDGMPVDEFMEKNADPIWLHQEGMWELIPDEESEVHVERYPDPETGEEDVRLPF